MQVGSKRTAFQSDNDGANPSTLSMPLMHGKSQPSSPLHASSRVRYHTECIPSRAHPPACLLARRPPRPLPAPPPRRPPCPLRVRMHAWRVTGGRGRWVACGNRSAHLPAREAKAGRGMQGTHVVGSSHPPCCCVTHHRPAWLGAGAPPQTRRHPPPVVCAIHR